MLKINRPNTLKSNNNNTNVGTYMLIESKHGVMCLTDHLDNLYYYISILPYTCV